MDYEEKMRPVINELERGRREINANERELTGWADRIMRSILTVKGTDFSKYPIGHNIPFRGRPQDKIHWNV